jgi:hypothetical protein
MLHDYRELKVGSDAGQGRHLCEPLCCFMGYQVSGMDSKERYWQDGGKDYIVI